MIMSAHNPIQQLAAAVVNRIAAGEVIHRPSGALKELIENSLDAGATSINICVKNGGLSLLQIQDNGKGIQRSDFPLVCMRFATSKLSTYDDLSSISTYGFRGEALASISHVSRVSITSMPPGSMCAHRANFSDGILVDNSITNCAGILGTTISVADLFFNVPARRAALSSASEEYRRIVEVVQRYAIRHASRGVSFSCKQLATVAPDVLIAANTSTLDAIAAVFGHGIRRELLPLEIFRQMPEATAASDADVSQAAAQGSTSVAAAGAKKPFCSGFFSNANFSLKRGVAIIFINDRLVDCAPLRRALDAVYSELLPKGSHSFVYLALQLPSEDLDVNVHPTKREVNIYQGESLRYFFARYVNA
jgi:DNA mismatch repair protein MLH1